MIGSSFLQLFDYCKYEKERNDFRDFTRSSTSFNRGNMFICKSRETIKRYYESIFPWLLECEKIFGFNLTGYGKIRIYAFLAERYLSYWFSKYTNPLLCADEVVYLTLIFPVNPV